MDDSCMKNHICLTVKTRTVPRYCSCTKSLSLRRANIGKEDSKDPDLIKRLFILFLCKQKHELKRKKVGVPFFERRRVAGLEEEMFSFCKKDSALKKLLSRRHLRSSNERTDVSEECESLIVKNEIADNEIARHHTNQAIDCLPEVIFLKIFGYFSIPCLSKASRTCKKWRRLSYDRELWRDVDMHPYRKRLDEETLVRIIRDYFFGSIQELSLDGYTVTPKILHELANCETLKSLSLDKCSFEGHFSDNAIEKSFPTGLTSLSLRFVGGEKDVLPLICSKLCSVKEFCIAGSFANEEEIITGLIKSLAEVRVLMVQSFAHFGSLQMNFIAKSCKYLKSLTLKHCFPWTGEGLDAVVEACRHLEDLHLQATSLSDTHIHAADWNASKLRNLHVSWCRNVTEAGFASMICNLKYLEKLQICSCGNGLAITDGLARKLARSRPRFLKELNFSFSRTLTNAGIHDLISSIPSLLRVHLSHCSNLTSELLEDMQANTEVSIFAAFTQYQEEEFQGGMYDRGYGRG